MKTIGIAIGIAALGVAGYYGYQYFTKDAAGTAVPPPAALPVSNSGRVMGRTYQQLKDLPALAQVQQYINPKLQGLYQEVPNASVFATFQKTAKGFSDEGYSLR